jgi:serine/threonine-protein kinase
MKGTKIGSYIIEDKIGEGGMGVVYSAKHDRMNRPAVVKMLRKELADNPELAKRFENEATAAASIGHPGIVQVFDIGQREDGSLYIVMELLQGESMQTRLDRMGRVPMSQAISMIRQAAGALSAAHKAGIVHRDLKPDNMFIVPDPEVTGGERVKLLDFGIAKLAGDGAGTMQTKTGTMMGTPHYMSPEQCQGASNVDERSDLYSLGCILFQFVTGRTPFLGTGVGDFIVAHMTHTPPSLLSLAANAPPALDDVVKTLLAKNPAERFGSADALANALGHINIPDESLVGQPAIAATEMVAAENFLTQEGRHASHVGGQPGQPATTMGLSAGESSSGMPFQAGVNAPPPPADSPRDQRSSSTWLVMGILGALAIAGVTYGIASRRGEKPPEPVATASTETEAELPVEGIPAVGSEDAGVTTAEPEGAASVANGDTQATQPSAHKIESSTDVKKSLPTAEAKELAALRRASQKKAEREAAAKRNDATRAIEQKAAEQKAAEQKAAEQKAAEQRTAEAAADRLADQQQQTPNQSPEVQRKMSIPPDDPAADQKQIASKESAVKAAIQACGALHNVRQKPVVLTVVIGIDGRVKRSKLKPVGLGGLARCAESAAKKYKFGPRRKPLAFRVPVQL